MNRCGSLGLRSKNRYWLVFFARTLYCRCFYAVHLGVSAGITAVIVSLQPVFVSLIAVPMFREKLRIVQLLGLLLGLVGVALLLLPKILQGDYSTNYSALGLFSCFLALLGTTVGYLLQKRTGNAISFYLEQQCSMQLQPLYFSFSL